MSRRGRLLALVAAAAAGVVTGPPASAATTLTVTAGLSGAYLVGAPVPVRVRVDADRLVRGTLSVTVANEDTVALPVEVPGGSVKEYLLVAPSPPNGPSADVLVLLRAGSRELARQVGRVDASVEQEIVGLLPAAAGDGPVPGAIPLSPDLGVARFVRVDERLAATGPAGLARAGTIAAGTGDLAALSAEARSGVLRWIAQGGHLAVDDEADLGRLPEGWRPAAGQAVRVGRGGVAHVAGAVAAGSWPKVVVATERASVSDLSLSVGDSTLASALAVEAGVRGPQLGWLLGLLLTYVVLVGPATYVVLRRSRREELAWIYVPFAAVLFTAAGYVVARATREAPRAGQATVLDVTPDASSAITYVGVAGLSSGPRRVAFPRGWSDTGTGSQMFRASRTDVTPEGLEQTLRISTGEFETASAAGPVSAGSLVIDASSDGASIEGTVRNATRLRLYDAGVVVGKNIVRLGDVEPGAEERFRTSAEPEGAHYRSVTAGLWPSAMQPSPNAARFVLWRLTGEWLGADLLASGDAVAVGWTRDYRPPVRIDGRATTAPGWTLVVSRAPVRQSSGAVASLAVHREQLRGPAPLDLEPGTDILRGDQPAIVLRFTLPSDVQSGRLVLRGPSAARRIEVWDGSAWRTVGENVTGDDGRGGPFEARGRPVPAPFMGPLGMPDGPEVAMRDYDVPAPAGRTVFVRISHEGVEPHTGWAYTLKERT